jgi:hypothetical protein
MDIGRNEPCPCGSGKKYKRCCGVPHVDALEAAASVLRATQTSAEAKVWRFLQKDLGEGSLADAWEEFAASASGFDAGRDEEALFRPWVTYDWVPWEPITLSRGGQVNRPTVTLMALAQPDHGFSKAESAFLFSVAATPFSFHEVTALEPSRTITLRDLMMGATLTVYDRLGSTNIEPGQILFARPTAFETAGLVIGSGQFVIPPMFKKHILKLRKELKPRLRRFSYERLHEVDPDLRSMYFAIREQLVDPPMPELVNTDGDPMEFHTLTYTIASVEAALTALAPLAGDDTERLMTEATRARPGGSPRAAFSWAVPGNRKHAGMSNTVIADFKLSGTTLKVEVNSAKRAKRVKAEIAKRLGDHAILVRDERLPMDEALAKAATEPESRRDRAARLRNEELQARPEAQAAIEKMLTEHYATWPDTPLPALNGKTPRAAMRTREGRERVEALLAEFERVQDRGTLKMPRYDFNQLRAMLGLPLREA